MVMRIAIVDDDEILLKNIRDYVYEYFSKHKIIVKIDIFPNHRLLMYELGEQTYYDLFLLDVEINNSKINGMDMAKKIREIDEKAFIIFITSHMKYTLEAFKVEAFRYIPKTGLNRELRKALDEVLERQRKREKSFYVIETVTKYIKIYYDDIYYIYKREKYSIINSITGEYKVRKSLATVNDELNSEEFIFVERGFIANITHIEYLEDEKIVLDNGERLKVSRAQVHFVKNKLIDYWGKIHENSI